MAKARTFRTGVRKKSAAANSLNRMQQRLLQQKCMVRPVTRSINRLSQQTSVGRCACLASTSSITDSGTCTPLSLSLSTKASSIRLPYKSVCKQVNSDSSSYDRKTIAVSAARSACLHWEDQVTDLACETGRERETGLDENANRAAAGRVCVRAYARVKVSQRRKVSQCMRRAHFPASLPDNYCRCFC